MFKRKNKSEQRGTLMVEAIAMLGLIAIVTPTLYKKSAERLQEIQDINIASQARTMASVIETFVRNRASVFQDYADSNSVSVFEICKNDDCKSDSGSSLTHLPNFLSVGYSSAIPYGFKPQDVKYFGDPRVFVVSEEGNIVFYVVYPRQQDLGKRRATRLASLVGAQGGIVENAHKIQGTGGAWELDSSMIDDMNLDSSLILENSLVLTNSEPITTKFEDTDKFLYRIPPDDPSDYYHNTMVTDLYLGANREDNSLYSAHSYEHYSIFNVRKMTLNTDCSARRINKGDTESGVDTSCDPDVADLYIGKPFGKFNEDPRTPTMSGTGTEKHYGANTGAAWIYGNLSALNDRFKMWNTEYDSSGTSYERTGYDILQFAHEDTISTDSTGAETVVAGNSVFMASNEENKGQVAMIDGMVRAVENFDTNETANSTAAFLVGGSNSSLTAADGRLITAFSLGSDAGRVYINNTGSSDVTRINSKGGDVYINGLDSASADGQILAHTYINPRGGELLAGEEGQWINAGEIGDSAHVDIFSSQVGLRFTVGGKEADSSQIWSDKQVTALRDGAIRAYKFDGSWENTGGADVITGASGYENGFTDAAKMNAELTNAVVLGSKYTDVLGSTYMGIKGQMEATLDGVDFARDEWRLGVAGSAWVDELLFANEAWFNSSGAKELHAGFSSFTEFKNRPRTAWLNAYDDGVLIRNRVAAADSSATAVRPEDARFYAGENDVYLGDSKGAMAHLSNGIAEFGYADDLSSSGIPQLYNKVGADSERAFVVGNKLTEIYTSSDVTGNDDVAVDIQKGAMLFQGYSWKDSSRTEHDYDDNTINAHAGEFAVHTRQFKDSEGAIVDDARGGVFYANSSDVLTRVVDFSVQDNKGEYVLKARPMIDDIHSSQANVEIDGSFHVTGNRVIHVASVEQNAAGSDTANEHAMFEVDPNYVRVLALDGNDSTYVDGRGGEPLAILEVNPYDIDGSSTVTRDAEGGITDFENDPTDRASVYVRRGAIELERSHGTGAAADSGYGYIKANRLVSSAEDVRVPTVTSGMADSGKYDQYMVNPAYTSVMHDIKLTTRGGARLSDILPDYVLKGVYNVSNDYLENGRNRICWSSNNASGCNGALAQWASPYVGIIPYAVCPPGYRNMATIVPISFQMGQAGEVLKPSEVSPTYGATNGAYVVNSNPRQAKVLSAAGDKGIFYPTYEEVTTFHYNKMVTTGADFNPAADIKELTAGWFLGPRAAVKETGVSGGFDVQSKMEPGGNNTWNYWEDKAHADDFQTVAEPLYFQQNTFLKTTLTPAEKGWEGRMGFLYDKSVYVGLGNGLGQDGILSNNNPKGYNDDNSSSLPFALPGTWVWNLFPVPTNTLEGHATVYCYFDRKKFKDGEWSNLVDPIDQMNDFRQPFKADGTGADSKPENYLNRLNDPTLKYSDPW